jgi:hypothetical protein
VHVVVGVPDRDPPHRAVITAPSQAEPVDVQLGDLRPLGVRQRPVGRGGADRQVVGRLDVLADPSGTHGGVQQRRQADTSARPSGPTRRLQRVRALVAGDDPGIDVRGLQTTLPSQALGEQVAEQPAGVGASPAHLPDHQRCRLGLAV